MKNAAILVALLMAATALPAQAGLFRDDPIVVHIPALRVGDAFRAKVPDANEYDEDGTVVATYAQEHLGEVEGPRAAIDGYGIERETVAVRQDVTWDGQLASSTRCHLLAGGTENVRTEWLFGRTPMDSSQRTRDWSLLGIPIESSEASRSANLTTSFGGRCDTPFLGPSTGDVAEGDRVPFEAVFPREAGIVIGPSAPAAATTFRGAPALLLVYDLPASVETASARAEVVLVDGIPLVAEIRVITEPESFVYWSLAGFRHGPGPGLPRLGDARLPDRHPEVSAARYEPLAIDDGAFGLAYPFAAAFENARTDPRSGLEAFLKEHPDAVVVHAAYEEGIGLGEPAPTEPDGSWTIIVSDDSASWIGFSSRSRLPGQLGALQPDAAKVKRSGGAQNDEPFPLPVRHPPADLVSGADVLSVAAAHGVDTGRITVVEYWAHQFEGDPATIRWRISTIPAEVSEGRAEGRAVDVDAVRGFALGIFEGSAQGSSDGIVNALRPVDSDLGEDAARSSFAVLAGVPEGLGLTAGAAVAAGILVLLAKLLLVPLFTRLRRDRLLDNPVRARLYERIRADPGIHRADLVDFLGVGEGGTRHHLKQLVSHRLVVELPVDGFVRYFAAGEVPPQVAREVALLKAGSLRRVHDLDVAEPGLSLREAARRLGISAPSVYKARARLRRSGLVADRPVGAPVMEIQ